MFSQWKTNKESRNVSGAALKSGLDVLVSTDGTMEAREALCDELKKHIDIHFELETTNDKYEYIAGRLTGMLIGIGVTVGGYIIGGCIKHLINK